MRLIYFQTFSFNHFKINFSKKKITVTVFIIIYSIIILIIIHVEVDFKIHSY